MKENIQKVSPDTNESIESIVGSFIYNLHSNVFTGTNEKIIEEVEKRMALGQGKEPYWLKNLKLKTKK